MNIKKTLSDNAVDNRLKHATGLSAVWQHCICPTSGPDHRMLTPKEHGQLKRLKKSLGAEKAQQVIECVIQNWEAFARQATENAGSEVFPIKPHIGFLLKYHATALILVQDELQSAVKKKAAEEQAKKNAQFKEEAETKQELKSKTNSITLIRLTQEQLNAYLDVLDDPANEAWFDQVTEKYGEWRPDHNGIPCDIELKKAG